MAAGILLSAVYYFWLKRSYDAHVFLLPAIGLLQAIYNINMVYRLAFGRLVKSGFVVANGLFISGFIAQFAMQMFDFTAVIAAVLSVLILNIVTILFRPAFKS